MSVLDILKPAPPKEEIEDEKEIEKKYKYWRMRIFYSMYIGYALFYFTRKSFNLIAPVFKEYLHFDVFQIGLLSSIFSIVYGISKFVSGIIGDKSNPRYFMSLGLILTAIFTICFGLSSNLFFFALFWGLNAWFQGWGWPGCAKLLTHWYSNSERGRWWSMWNTSHNLGGSLIPILISIIVFFFGGWRLAMIIPGCICLLAGIFLSDRLRDTPQSLGLPKIEKFRNDYPHANSFKKEKLQLPAKEILFRYVLNNRYIWVLAFSYFFVYVVRTAINDWSVLYLVESKSYPYVIAGGSIFWFEAGGFVGSLCAGWASDKIFKGKRNPINVLFSIGVIFPLMALWKFGNAHLFWDFLNIFFIGFFIFGPQMLIGVAAAELSHKKAAATATGFAGCFAYIGAAFAGAPLGLIMQKWGWEGFFFSLSVCVLVSTLLLFPMWSLKTNPKEA